MQALVETERRCLTLPSSGLAPAGRATLLRHFTFRAACRREPLMSNVRPQMKTAVRSVFNWRTVPQSVNTRRLEVFASKEPCALASGCASSTSRKSALHFARRPPSLHFALWLPSSRWLHSLSVGCSRLARLEWSVHCWRSAPQCCAWQSVYGRCRVRQHPQPLYGRARFANTLRFEVFASKEPKALVSGCLIEFTQTYSTTNPSFRLTFSALSLSS